jgi:hypothetical protein
VVRLKDRIIISKETILEKYQNLQPFYVSVISVLYGNGDQDSDFRICEFKTSDIVKEGRNNLRELKVFEGKTGVYIFTDEQHEPVYIGLAGERESSDHSLKERLQKQLNADLSNSTLAKNIGEIEGLLKNDPNMQNTRDKNGLKKLINEYSPKLIVISTGDLNNNEEAREKAQILEKMLIALLRPKYNR